MQDLSKQLPDVCETLKFIQQTKNSTEIAMQARKEMRWLENLDNIMENGQSGAAILQQIGYHQWLQDAEDEDRLRLIGTLKLIVDFCEEMSTD